MGRTVTVGELITILKTCDPAARVQIQVWEQVKPGIVRRSDAREIEVAPVHESGREIYIEIGGEQIGEWDG